MKVVTYLIVMNTFSHGLLHFTLMNGIKVLHVLSDVANFVTFKIFFSVRHNRKDNVQRPKKDIAIMTFVKSAGSTIKKGIL